MIEFKTGNDDGIVFVIETKTELEFEQVKDSLKLAQFTFYDDLKRTIRKAKGKPLDWYESGVIVFNDHVAIHISDLNEDWDEDVPKFSAHTFLRFKPAKRTCEYPTTVTLEER